MNYSSLLLPAASLSDPVSRLQQVATFAVSALAGNENRSVLVKRNRLTQCSGSEFHQFHRIHMFLGLMDPDPLVRGMDPDPNPAPDPDPVIIKHK